MSLTPKQAYVEKKIREGFSSVEVNMWQALCRQCEMEVENSLQHMWTILDIARHNQSDVLDVVKTGMIVSNQKSINQKFMHALLHAVYEENPSQEAPVDFDLTCEEELSASHSGSYEETTEPYDEEADTPGSLKDFVVNDNPTSTQAYDIDDDVDDKKKVRVVPQPKDTPRPKGVKRLLKRKIVDSQAEEE